MIVIQLPKYLLKMKKVILCLMLAQLLSIDILNAQFIVKNETFQPTGLSNQGKVAGYAAQAGPYAIWLPDSGNVMINIAGLAPGNGIGGQARFSLDGNFICGTSAGANGAEMSRYNRATDQWTLSGSLGFQVDATVSGGYGISGDGNIVVGNSWADTTGGFAYTRAVAMTQTGLVDLGSLYSDSGKSTRANAVNYDGSVVVGWQDLNGPWKSAVWRKKPTGGYYQNQFLLIDTTGNPNDQYNQLGECSCVSPDGNWIGGYGDFANNSQPWIWSKDSGVINLGTLPNVGTGYVTGMNADASIVVGWFDAQLFGDPTTPFIRTRAGGLQELNAYIHSVLGDSTGTDVVYTADCMSPDGHYIAGYGIDTSTFASFAYRVSLSGPTAVHEVAQTDNVKIYPNPFTDQIQIQTPDKGVLNISSMDGRMIRQIEISGNRVLDLSEYASGIYLFSLQTRDELQTRKVVKN